MTMTTADRTRFAALMDNLSARAFENGHYSVAVRYGLMAARAKGAA